MKTTKEMFYYKEEAILRVEELTKNKKQGEVEVDDYVLVYDQDIIYHDEFRLIQNSWESGHVKAKLLTLYEYVGEKRKQAINNYIIGWWTTKELEKSDRRGGKRPGAGRKPSKNKKITVSLYISEILLSEIRIEAKCCGYSISKYIEEIIENTMK